MSLGGGKVGVSTDEIIATVNHSMLPTLIVEGADDIVVFRRLEADHSEIGLSVLGVGGRDAVLEIFERRAEISTEKKVGFVADRDIWIYSSVPQEFDDPHLILTRGYSIENDVFIDGRLRILMTLPERLVFQVELKQFIEWFALALSRYLAGDDEPISRHPNELLNSPARRAELLALSAGEVYPEELRIQIAGDYERLLRGKSLLALVLRRLSRAGRHPMHSRLSILEMISHNNGECLSDIFNRVRALMA